MEIIESLVSTLHTHDINITVEYIRLKAQYKIVDDGVLIYTSTDYYAISAYLQGMIQVCKYLKSHS